MKKMQIIKNINKNKVGDTIVEVLIAIAVAAFAIGTAYAIANKSLQRAISARERNQSIAIIQNQITDLKTRYKTDPGFIAKFGIAAGQPGPNVGQRYADYYHFCLIDDSKGPTDPIDWNKQDNDFSGGEVKLETLNVPPYNPACRIKVDGTYFFIDITAMITAKSVNAFYPTVYRVKVRWSQPGDGKTGSSEVYYRVGAAVSSTPLSCAAQYYDIVLVLDTSISMEDGFKGAASPKKIDVAKDAAKSMVDNVGLAPGKNEMAFVTFNNNSTNNATIWKGFTTDSADLKNTIDSVPTHAGTYFIPPLDKTKTVLATSNPAKGRIVIFISDGSPDDVGNAPYYTPPYRVATYPPYNVIYSKAREVWGMNAALYTIGIDLNSTHEAFRPPQEIMTNMAGGTNRFGQTGSFKDVTDQAGLEDILLNLAGRISC
jgi:type II secretory pathway pseudopilin PulG